MQTIQTNNNTDPFRAFPDPVDLPETVDQARADRTSRLVRASSTGVAVRLSVIVLELAAFWAFGYSVLLVDGLASLADVVASVAIIVAIKIAERPPDDDHPFGHGRFEALAGMQLGILICGLGVAVIGQQFLAVVSESAAGDVAVWVAAIPFGAAVLFESLCRLILRIGRREHSTALISEAYHYRVDALTSLVAAVGILVAAGVPHLSNLIDHLSAILLAGIMLVLGAIAVWQNVHQILDRAPDSQWFERVRSSAEKVDGVLDVEKVRMQFAGPDAHVNIDIEVDPRQTVSEAHLITQQVRAQIQTDWPAVRDVVVHVEPYFDGDH